jgi:putative Mn2+ efflux pump MntP
MLLGGRIGDRWGSRVEILGGCILIGIGIKILAEHLLMAA